MLKDHPRLKFDSLSEKMDMKAGDAVVHRYPDKALFLRMLSRNGTIHSCFASTNDMKPSRSVRRTVYSAQGHMKSELARS